VPLLERTLLAKVACIRISSTPTDCVAGPEPRMSEFYDNYLDSYAESPEPPLPSNAMITRNGSSGSGSGSSTGGAVPDRIAAWARSDSTQRGARSSPSSQYAPSSYGGSMRRKLTRRGTTRSRMPVNMYEEEEEGYVSGEYEDGPFELVKIRVKVGLPG
jgi:neutrophil factor 2